MSHHKQPQASGLHKKWYVWVALVLMLVGMAVYILTLDETRF